MFGKDYGELISSCQRYGIPVLKKNGDAYATSTLMQKVRLARTGEVERQQTGGRVPSPTMPATMNDDGGRLRASKKAQSAETKKAKKLSERAQAILTDPLIRAYLDKRGVTRITEDTTVPLGVILAVYGNQTELGASGISALMPDYAENPELKKYWKAKGVAQVTPMTEIPVSFIYLLD